MRAARTTFTALTVTLVLGVTAAPAAAKSLPLEAQAQAEATTWQRFAYEQAAALATIEQAVYDVQLAVGAYVADVQAQEAAAAAAAAQAEAERQAAARAAQARSAPAAPMGTSTARTGGGHSDAWWRGVAQCEQGGRNDPYYGYFSFMDGSAGGLSWDAQVAKGNALLSRVPERLSQGGAWADACVNAGYAASPGG